MIASLLLKFWPHIIAGLVITALLATVMYWKSRSDELGLCRNDLTEAAAHMATIQQQAATNRSLADDYYTQLDDISRQLAAAKRVQPQRCVCPLPRTSTASDTPACAGGELSQAHGVTAGTLYDFAADCERVRQQLLGWQRWGINVMKYKK